MGNFDEKTLKMRRSGIGASETPSLFPGCTIARSYNPPIKIYQSKLGLIEDSEMSTNAEIGILLEPLVANKFSKKYGVELVDPKEVLPDTNGIIFSEEYPFMMATLDRWVKGTYHPVQIKVFSPRRKEEFGEDGSEVVPLDYRIQCIKELGIIREFVKNSGIEVELPELAYLAVLFYDDSKTMLTFVIPWDEEIWNAIRAVDEEFWYDHIIPQDPPEPDGSDEYTRFAVNSTLEMAQESFDEVAVADDEMNDLALTYFQAKEVIAKAEKIASIAKQRFVLLTGGKKKASGDFGKMTLVGGREATYVDWEGVAAAMNPPAELVAQFTGTKTTASYPRFTQNKNWVDSIGIKKIQLIEEVNND